MTSDYDEILEKMKTGEPITVQSTNAGYEFNDRIRRILADVLKFNKIESFLNPLSTVLFQLISNANKANLKRVYFRLNQLDINDENVYKSEIQNFINAYNTEPEKLEKYLSDYKMNVKVVFKEYKDRTFTVFVANSSLLIDGEKVKIKENIENFKLIQSGQLKIGDLVASGKNPGLGLIITLKALDAYNIDSSCLAIGVKDNYTISKISFEYPKGSPEDYSIIAKEILLKVKTLPKFPQNIKSLLTHLLNPDITITEISEELEKDPALTADLLKIVNSAMFMLNRKISSIPEALNIIGIKGLKNLLYSYGAIRVMTDNFGSMNEFWDRAYKTAKYSTGLSKLLDLNKKSDEAYTSGLLHNIGKIILLNFDSETISQIEDVCMKKGVSSSVMEELILGINHAKIGANIAKAWGFPQSLINAISFQNNPAESEEDLELICVVYLSKYFANKQNEEALNIFDVDKNVRDIFGIESTEDLIALYQKTINN